MTRYYLRNISKRHIMFLQRPVNPGEAIELNEAFKGFCLPKISSKDQARQLDKALERGEEHSFAAEFKADDFDGFLKWVLDLASDKTKWEYYTEDEKSVSKDQFKPKKKPVPRKATIKASTRTGAEQTLSIKDVKRKLPIPKDISAKSLAWLPYNDETKKLIADLGADQIRMIKTAVKMAKNIAGQEDLRYLLEDKIQEMARDGIS